MSARDRTISVVDFVPVLGEAQDPAGVGLTYIDHLTHNVHRGRMKKIRCFDIDGSLTGLKSKAMTSPPTS